MQNSYESFSPFYFFPFAGNPFSSPNASPHAHIEQVPTYTDWHKRRHIGWSSWQQKERGKEEEEEEEPRWEWNWRFHPSLFLLFPPPPQKKRENQAARWWLPPSPPSLWLGWGGGGSIIGVGIAGGTRKRRRSDLGEDGTDFDKGLRGGNKGFWFFVVVLKVLLSVLKIQQTFCQDKKMVDPSTFEGTE